jgi:hypothetical protein
MGTNGAFYLNGDNEGTCAGVKPTYFRVDTSAPHWKEFYTWILTASMRKKSMTCMVDSGCGTGQLWIHYCRGSIK